MLIFTPVSTVYGYFVKRLFFTPDKRERLICCLTCKNIAILAYCLFTYGAMYFVIFFFLEHFSDLSLSLSLISGSSEARDMVCRINNSNYSPWYGRCLIRSRSNSILRGSPFRIWEKIPPPGGIFLFSFSFRNWRLWQYGRNNRRYWETCLTTQLMF